TRCYRDWSSDVCSSDLFVPDTWIDISTTLGAKLEAMACYESELRDYPHPRSLEALAHRARASGNQVCLDAAEVFMTVRRIHRNEIGRASCRERVCVSDA